MSLLPPIFLTAIQILPKINRLKGKNQQQFLQLYVYNSRPPATHLHGIFSWKMQKKTPLVMRSNTDNADINGMCLLSDVEELLLPPHLEQVFQEMIYSTKSQSVKRQRYFCEICTPETLEMKSTIITLTQIQIVTKIYGDSHIN